MTRTLLSRWSGLALLTLAMPAQQTWVVDPNGTGDFTDLQVAIQTAASGDTLLLRGGGQYTGWYSFQKHLSFVGVPPLRSRIRHIDLLATPGTSLSIVGVDVSALLSSAPIRLEDVTLARCQVGPTHAFLNRCTLGQPNPTQGGPALFVYGGNAVISSSTLYGGAATAVNAQICHVIPGGPPVQVYAGSVTVADSTLIGAPPQQVNCPNSRPIAPAGPALTIGGSGATAWISQSTLSAGHGGSHAVSASLNTTVYHDNQSQFAPAYTGTLAFLPATLGNGAPPGGTITCRAQTEPGYPTVIAASLGKHAPSSFPAIRGTGWIDPNAFVGLAIGFADNAGQLPATISLPASVPRGLPITVQAAVAPPNAGLSAATPVVVHVR